MQFVCEHCGKPYNKGEKYCKGCWKALPEDNLAEAVIENTDDYEVEAFIGKNADYYMEKFKKHRDKQLFMSLTGLLCFSAHLGFSSAKCIFTVRSFLSSTLSLPI